MLKAMPVRRGEYCYRCGLPADYAADVPHCSKHDALWLLRRNAPSASAMIVRDGRILLSRRAREPWAAHWETPGGYLNESEHPEKAVRREVEEELGLAIRDLELVGVFVEEWAPGQWVQNTVHLASPEVGEVQPDSSEVSDWAWFPLDALPEPMAAGQRDRIIAWWHRSR